MTEDEKMGWLTATGVLGLIEQRDAIVEQLQTIEVADVVAKEPLGSLRKTLLDLETGIKNEAVAVDESGKKMTADEKKEQRKRQAEEGKKKDASYQKVLGDIRKLEHEQEDRDLQRRLLARRMQGLDYRIQWKTACVNFLAKPEAVAVEK